MEQGRQREREKVVDEVKRELIAAMREEKVRLSYHRNIISIVSYTENGNV